jgi:hypothetical protein
MMLANREIIFAASAVLFLGAGAYHLYGLIASLADPGLAAFHAAFVVIDPVVAFLLLRRPDWFPYAFAALTIQQIYSHGAEAVTAWREMSMVDYVSLLIIVFMPSLLVLLVYDALLRKSRTS